MEENKTHTVVHDEHRDDEASKIGMWLFLFTEILLFGGLFLVYSIYRYMNPDDFASASENLDVFVLLTSLFVPLAKFLCSAS